MTTEPRYTHVWWGDGYFVYDGDRYLGKDDQLDEVHDLMVPVGATRVIDIEDLEDIDFAPDSLTELLVLVQRAHENRDRDDDDD